jgi:tRNA-Thr(GGU) m(6)t(6)A37 methyltransferase TsaA
MQPIQIQPIGIIHSCFKEKFATPRQPGLVPAATAQVKMLAPYNVADAFEGLADFSHIWLSFAFHQTAQQGWKPKVRPPRLGGNAKLGVFATRSTFRPNPLGLSVVKLEAIDISNGVILHVSGADLIDQTPILDIKPYLPWVESIADAKSGFASENQTLQLPIQYSPQAQQALSQRPELAQLIEQVLQQDPRPAYQQDPQRIYGCRLDDINLRWQVGATSIDVVAINTAE